MFYHDHNKTLDILSSLQKRYDREGSIFNNNMKDIDIYNFYSILSIPKNKLLPYLQRAEFLTKQYFGKTIQLYDPVYISDECINKCEYCSFKHNSNTFSRLNDTRLKEEYEYLKSKKIDNLLIVSGQGKYKENRDLIIKSIEKAKKYFSSIALEIGTYKNEDLLKFYDHGADSYILYQETYNPVIYNKLHPQGIKKDYKRRIESIENSLNCGFEKIGMGVLYGLYDYKYEAISLFNHIKYIYSNYYKAEITLSFPRIVTDNIDFQTPYKINDLDLLRLFIAFRIAFPDIGITLSTRESPQLRNKLIKCGVTQMSAQARTTVGGYTDNSFQNGQFETQDRRSIDEIEDLIIKNGYYPVYKNWDIKMNIRKEIKCL